MLIKRKDDIIIILKEAFNKATQRDLSNITFLKKDDNPENYIRIYDAYVDLNNRQERIKPLLPLYVKGREVKLNFKNYTNEIVKFKVNASKHIYTKANNLINSNDKLNARLAYKELEIIEDINPNYKDVRRLMDLAHDKGTDFVLVDMINDSGKIIPARLERDLLNFSSYGLKNFWAVYHSKPDRRIKYTLEACHIYF